MFTGLIEDIGTLRSLQRHGNDAHLRIATGLSTDDFTLGESIAVNGCCLTVTAIEAGAFTADASSETLRVTALGTLQTGHRVHLERAMAVGDRLGGHIVQGHVDGVGHIERVVVDGDAWQIYIEIPESLRPEVVHKGSIAIDGVSLTVNELTATGCRLTIIPHTAQLTLLSQKKAGDPIHIETDLIGKYVRHLLGPQTGAQRADLMTILQQNGYLETKES